MITVLAIIAGLLLLPVVVDLIRQPNLRRLGLRNMVRRPSEAALVTLGAMLATATICSSFVVGDTIDASIRDVARTDLGPLDEVIRIADDRAVFDAVLADPTLIVVDDFFLRDGGGPGGERLAPWLSGSPNRGI